MCSHIHTVHTCTLPCMYMYTAHVPSNFFNSYITCTAVSREEDKLKQVCTKVPSRMMVAYL